MWDFGDGTPTSPEVSTMHRFESTGSFEVSLTVEDSQGLRDTKSITIVVLEQLGEGGYETGAWLLANPARNIAQVRIIDETSELRKVLKIYLYDSAGRLLGAFDPRDVVANGLYEIPIAMLSSGENLLPGF